MPDDRTEGVSEEELMRHFNRLYGDGEPTDAPKAEDETTEDEVEESLSEESADAEPADETQTDEDEGQDAEDDAPGEPETTEPEAPVNVGGREFAPDEADVMVRVYDWARQLSDEERQTIDLLFSGQYLLVEKTEYDKLTSTTGVSQSDTDADADAEYLDPKLKGELDTVKAELAQFRQEREAQAQAQYQQTLERYAQISAQVSTEYATEKGLSDKELERLQTAVVEAQIIPGLTRTMDVGSAVRRALETVYWTDEEFRQRELEKRLSDEREKEKAETAKRRKASSLAGGGGNVARNTAPPTTEAGRYQAMVAELAEAMNNGART
jgi:hypothetical protein